MDIQKEQKKIPFREKLRNFIKSVPNFFKETLFLIRFIILLFFVFGQYLIDRAQRRTLDKKNRRSIFEFKFLKGLYQKIYKKVLLVLDFSKENDIYASDLIFLALRNLSAKKNRTYVTIGGMAVGFGAVILLLSLGYGFERLVITRVASLSELKQVDVNVSQGSPLSLSKETIEQIEGLEGVDITLPIITSVSKVKYNNAVSDVIIYGVIPRYFDETGVLKVQGNFLPESDAGFSFKERDDDRGVVAGVSSVLIGTKAFNTPISTVKYSIFPQKWKPVYMSPDINSEVVGYTKREIGLQDGQEVWGKNLQSGTSRRSAIDFNGKKYSSWIQGEFYLWEKKDCSMKEPDCLESNYLVKRDSGKQTLKKGYITQEYVTVARYEVLEGASLEIYDGKIIEEIPYKIKSSYYTDIFFDLKKDSLRSTILPNESNALFSGKLVYGPYYESANNTFVQDTQGRKYSYWVKSTIPVWFSGECSSICDVYQTYEGKDLQRSDIDIYLKASDIEISNDLNTGDVLGSNDSSEEVSGSKNSSLVDINELINNGDDDIDWVSISSELGVKQDIDKEIKEIPEGAKKVAMVNTGMLSLLGISQSEAVGKSFESTIIFDNKLFEKSNYVVESEPVTFEILGVVSDSRAPAFYVCLDDIWVDGIKNVSQLKVILDQKDMVSNVRENIESMGFKTSSVVDTVDRIGTLFKTLRVALLTLGLIALGVASLGMFNTLTVSLLEKTREVGLLKTMGLKSREVKVLFLAESIIMSVLGGLSGLLFGFVVGKLISALVSVLAIIQGQGYVDLTYIPFVLSVAIMVLSSVVGVVTGWYPSKRATEISALNALRYE